MNEQVMKILIPSLTPLINAVASRYLNNDQEVEDVTQDVLLKFLCAIRKGNLRSPRNWIAATARNTALDCLRQLKKRRYYEDHKATARLNSSHDDRALHLPTQSRSSDCDLSRLSQLPDSQRLALFLSACGYSYKEIADRQKVSIGTVRSRIHYARIKSQSLLSAST